MSADDIVTYTCQHIEALWADNFLHMVKMGMGNQPGTTAMLSIMLLSSGVTAPIALLISSPTILVLSFHYLLSH